MNTQDMALCFNANLLNEQGVLDPYGTKIDLPVLNTMKDKDHNDLCCVFYVAGSMMEEGDHRQFMVLACNRAEAIHAYDLELQRQLKLLAKEEFDREKSWIDSMNHMELGFFGWVKRDQAEAGDHFPYRSLTKEEAQALTFAQWWSGTAVGSRYSSEHNFTPDVCLQLTHSTSLNDMNV